MNTESVPSKRATLQGPASVIVSALALLLPIFFVPNAAFPFQFSKVLLALSAVVLAFVFFAVKALRDREFSFDWSVVSLAFFVLPFTYLVSAAFSSVPALSFAGYQLDQDTFGFMALAGALAFVTTLSARSEAGVLSAITGFFVGGFVALLFQAVQIFFGAPIGFGLFTSPTQNLVGSWNDFGIFAGLMGALSLLALETLSLSALRRGVLVAALALSLALLAVVNFPLAWGLFGVVAFGTLVFSLLQPREAEAANARGTKSAASLIALVIVVFFLFFGSGAAGALQSRLGISTLDVSPSFQGTLGVLEHVFAKNPVFGSGPNTFGHQWFLARPAATLSSVFWAVDFNSGYGYLLTALSTGGIVVGFGWLVLIALFLWVAWRALLSAPAADEWSYFLLAATAVLSALLLVAHALYNPSQSLTLFLFLFLGLFAASLRSTRFLKTYAISFSGSPRVGFVSVIILTAALVLSLVSVYRVGESYAGAVYAGRAAARSNANDVPGALSALGNAVLLSPQDSYYRGVTALELSQLNALVASGKNDQKTQQAFQTGLSRAIGAANQAVAYDPSSYANQMNRASVYEAVVPLNIQGAADNALQALEKARVLNPFSPEVDYQEAALKEFAKDHAGATALAKDALAKKADYTPAILLTAQIALNQGNLSDAVDSLKSAIVFNPQDQSLLYQLGLLQMQNKSYADAAASFQSALAVSPGYANAKFFLAGADLFLGKKDDALGLLRDLESSNAGNQTLENVVSAVEKGQNPFATSTPSLLPPAPSAAGG